MRILLFLLTFLSFNLYAENHTKNQAKELIEEVVYQLEKDGFISEKDTNNAINKLNNNKDFKESIYEILHKESTNWTQYITFMNILKLAGIILLLIAARGILFKIIKSIMFVIIAVPLIFYQIGALSLGILLTYNSEFFWSEESFYVSLFGSTLNLIVIGWIMHTYQGVLDYIISLLNKIKISEEIFLLSFLTGYYYHLTLLESSNFYGAVTIGLFIGLSVYCITRFIKDLTEKSLLYVFHFFSLALFSLFIFLDMTKTEHFLLNNLMFGLEYISCIVVVISLLILSSPFFDKYNSLLPTIIIIALSMIGFVFGMNLGYTEVSGLINTLLLITILQWVFYLVKDYNYIVVCFVAGLLLFGSGKLIESYQNYFFTNLL